MHAPSHVVSLVSLSTPLSPALRYSDVYPVGRRSIYTKRDAKRNTTGRKEILDGMLGANLVCFQTYSYTRHFTSTCVRVCGYETTTRVMQAPSTDTSRSASLPRGKGVAGAEKYVGIDVQGHVATVTHCPVGVDAERVARDT